ncbi:hypothetical protein C1A38_14775 [Verrucosispora sp. ts21]|nr:hypothetical protein C1A38_14775 [Verrucosispora sp. ts21]
MREIGLSRLPTGLSLHRVSHSCRDRLLAIYPQITSRDRLLLQLLDDHQVLTIGQIRPPSTLSVTSPARTDNGSTASR